MTLRYDVSDDVAVHRVTSRQGVTPRVRSNYARTRTFGVGAHRAHARSPLQRVEAEAGGVAVDASDFATRPEDAFLVSAHVGPPTADPILLGARRRTASTVAVLRLTRLTRTRVTDFHQRQRDQD